MKLHPALAVLLRSAVTLLLLLLLPLPFLASPLVTAQETADTAPSDTVPVVTEYKDVVAVSVMEAVKSKDIASALSRFGTLADQKLPLKQISQERVPAAAAAIHRVLAQSSSDERYELLLEWTMPTDDRQSVRCLSVPVPVNAPPKAFAREIGQRPKDDTFPVASVAGTQGLFSSGWMLVQAADDVGRLSRLLDELKKLHADGVPGAETVLHLATAKSTRADSASLLASLGKIAPPSGKAAPKPAVAFSASDYNTIAIACAASQNDQLAAAATAALFRMAWTSGPARSFVRIAHAAATQNQLGKSSPEILFQRQFKHWVSTTGGSAWDCDRGQPSAMWLSHEGHLLHAAGGAEDSLMLRYPLTGEFDFICETQEGGDIGTDGGVVYGGLHFEAIGRANALHIFAPDRSVKHEIFCPFVRHESTPTFNRMSIRSADGKTAMETNFHPMWTFDESAAASPWLGLRSKGANRPVFRNPKLTGTPTIPRQVELIGKQSLRGWSGHFYYENVPSFVLAKGSDQQAENANWNVTEGVLSAVSSGEDDKIVPSLLRYERPLLESETIAYQFKHGQGDADVHPTVGRLAFLLESGGVRVRWLTDHVNDWTGLPSDHALVEPLSRRGPKPLPLKADDWNDVSVKRDGEFIDVSLNGELVYHRKIDFDGNFRFGFYRDRSDAVQIRKATMTGDWPETLPKEFFSEPFAAAENQKVATTKRTSFRMIGPTLIADNAMEFRRNLSTVDDTSRYAELRDWVLPVPSHGDFRLHGFFLPSHASPIQRSDPAFASWASDTTKGGPSNFASFFRPPMTWCALQQALANSTNYKQQSTRLTENAASLFPGTRTHSAY